MSQLDCQTILKDYFRKINGGEFVVTSRVDRFSFFNESLHAPFASSVLEHSSWFRFSIAICCLQAGGVNGHIKSLFGSLSPIGTFQASRRCNFQRLPLSLGLPLLQIPSSLRAPLGVDKSPSKHELRSNRGSNKSREKITGSHITRRQSYSNISCVHPRATPAIRMSDAKTKEKPPKLAHE